MKLTYTALRSTSIHRVTYKNAWFQKSNIECKNNVYKGKKEFVYLTKITGV